MIDDLAVSKGVLDGQCLALQKEAYQNSLQVTMMTEIEKLLTERLNTMDEWKVQTDTSVHTLSNEVAHLQAEFRAFKE